MLCAIIHMNKTSLLLKSKQNMLKTKKYCVSTYPPKVVR